MAGDRARVMQLLDASVAATEAARAGFTDEYPAGPTPPTPLPPIRVPVGGDVQAALTQARVEGATLLLAVGEHRCNLVVTDDPTAQPVRITSDTEALPPAGTRITREYESGLACLKSANNVDPVITYKLRSTGVDLIGLGVRPLQADRTMIVFGTDSMTSVEAQPHSIVHDRLLLLGDPVQGQRRGVMAHVRGYVLSNSSLLDFAEVGAESKCLAAWNGGQYLSLQNCQLEAGAVNVMFGGGDARVDALAPQHILIEGCDFTKNPAWVTASPKRCTKNLLEFKHARHVRVRHNTFTHCWAADWPSGVAIAIKCCDQHGREPWTLTEDITIEHNRLAHVGQVFSIVAKNDAGNPTQLMRGLTIRHNLATDLDCDQWQGNGWWFQLSNVPDDLVLDHNTVVMNNKGFGDFSFNDPARGQRLTLTNNVAWQGKYGLKGPSGMNCWNWETDLGYAPLVTGNAIRRHPERKLDFGPGNVVIPEADFDASLDAAYAVVPGSAVAAVPTTDGLLPGADVTRLEVPGRRGR